MQKLEVIEACDKAHELFCKTTLSSVSDHQSAQRERGRDVEGERGRSNHR